MTNSPGEPEPQIPTRGRLGLLGSALGPFAALALVVAFFAVADQLQERGGSFSTARNFSTISVQMARVAVAALGMTVVIIAGGIDLSAGSGIALCATVLAWFLKEDWHPAIAVAVCLATGSLAGCFNGFLVSSLRVIP